MSKLPEKEGPAEFYYNEEVAEKYDTNTRINFIQTEMAQRSVELLELKESGLILDIGCGSGISGHVLAENNLPWIGIDISRDMLNIAKNKSENLDLLQVDIGEGLPFKPGVFDGVIGVSVIQWLLEPYSSKHTPIQRIRIFFRSLYSICKNGSRCVFQFYVNDKKNLEILKKEAINAGFGGGTYIDKPDTKNAKSFLVLDVGIVNKSKIQNRKSCMGKNNQMKAKLSKRIGKKAKK